MKVKRRKTTKKVLDFFRISYDLQSPYKIIVDAAFVKAAADNHINLQHSLDTYFAEPVFPLVTTCSCAEIKANGAEWQEALDLSRTMKYWRCQHTEPMSSKECIKSVILALERKLILGLQDVDTRYNLRQIPGFPVIYLNHSVLVMERPSEGSTQVAKTLDMQRLLPTEVELIKLQKQRAAEMEERLKRRKKKKSGNPNPLSCMPKKKKEKSKKLHARDDDDENAPATSETVTKPAANSDTETEASGTPVAPAAKKRRSRHKAKSASTPGVDKIEAVEE